MYIDVLIQILNWINFCDSIVFKYFEVHEFRWKSIENRATKKVTIYKNGVGNKMNDSPETDMNLNQLIHLDFQPFFSPCFQLCFFSVFLPFPATLLLSFNVWLCFSFFFFAHSYKGSIDVCLCIYSPERHLNSIGRQLWMCSTQSIWWCIWFHVQLVSFGLYHFILSELDCWYWVTTVFHRV